MKFTFRPYLPADEADCFNLFDSNTPKYFGLAERPAFENFLKRLPVPFSWSKPKDGSAATEQTHRAEKSSWPEAWYAATCTA